jgi:hypothetical protein
MGKQVAQVFLEHQRFTMVLWQGQDMAKLEVHLIFFACHTTPNTLHTGQAANIIQDLFQQNTNNQ